MPKDRFRVVVETAQDLFGTRGYAATGMRDIARQAGLSPVQVYRLGLSKEDLLAEVSLRLTDHQIRHIAARARPRTGEPLTAFVERYLLALYRSDVKNLKVRRETAAYGWMWDRRHEQRIVAQVLQLLAPIEAALRAAQVSDPQARLFALWSLYYVGYRRAVVWGAGPGRCLSGIRPSLRLLLPDGDSSNSR